MQQQFLVPQFIDVEDKIIGPITTRQFVLMLVATLLMFIEFQLARFWFFVVQAGITFIVFGVLAFMKINGMPFHYFLLNLFQTLKRAGLRIWDKKLDDSTLKELMIVGTEKKEEKETFTPKTYSTSHLSKLSLIVNTGGVYKGGNDNDLPVENDMNSQK